MSDKTTPAQQFSRAFVPSDPPTWPPCHKCGQPARLKDWRGDWCDSCFTDTPSADPGAPKPWLESKIEYYTAEVQRLEAELHHAGVVLRGHETWLAEVERREGVMTPDVLTLENYAFELLNQLYDEFGVSDRNGEIARTIATENDPAGLQTIITALQNLLLEAMRREVTR